MSIPETVTDLLEPVIATLDVELLDVEWNGNSLRVVVDRVWPADQPIDKTDGITTQQLADVNRLISPILDQHDPVPGRYTLEVSSPGVERKLSRPDHYRRAIGEVVIVKMQPGAEPRRVKGELLAVADDASTLSVLGSEIDGIDQTEPAPVEIHVDGIQKARTSFDWGPAPKPGGGSGKKGGPGKKKGAKKSGGATSGSQAQLNTQLKKKDPT